MSDPRSREQTLAKYFKRWNLALICFAIIVAVAPLFHSIPILIGGSVGMILSRFFSYDYSKWVKKARQSSGETEK